MVGSRAAGVAVLSMVLALALAGCSSPGKEGAASSSSTSTGPAPVAAVIAWHTRASEEGGVPVAGDNRTELAVGTVLVFDASNSTGPIANYAWSFGDNATSPNKRAEHAYSGLGTYNVTLTVSSLANATATARTQVSVTFAPGRPLFRQHLDIGGDLPVMNPNSCTTQDVDCRDHVVTIAAQDAKGTKAEANRVHINVTGTSDLPAGDMQVFWKAPDGTTLAQTTASGFEHAIDYAGAMAPGDYVVRVRLFTGAQASYTGTVDVDYVTA